MVNPNEIKLISELYSNLSGQYTKILESVSEQKLNTVPFPNSWSIAQVVNHITKANNYSFLLAEGSKPNRPFDERLPELKETLLDFTLKMDSPEFILPGDRIYTKQESIEGIQSAFNQLSNHIKSTDLSLQIDTNSPLGIVTKWEIANFIVYHSIRHLHQLENIINYEKITRTLSLVLLPTAVTVI